MSKSQKTSKKAGKTASKRSGRSESAEPVRAYFHLKSDPASTGSGHEKVENIFISKSANSRTMESAQAILKQLGVHVVHCSPVSITIEATPSQFEDLFDAKIAEDVPATVKKTAEYQIPRKPVRFIKPPRIPSKLESLVEQIVLPGPNVTLK